MADDNQRAYFAHVQAIANEARRQEGEGYDLTESIHEQVDGSAFIIYTYKALKVLEYTSNEDAIFEELGRDALSGVDSFSDAITRMAFYVMMQDVYDHLPDEDEDEDEDED